MRPAERAPRRRRFFNPHRQEGQASFEFLLMMPFFIMGILIVVDFGILMYEYVSVANATREAARYGSVTCGAPAGCTVDALKDRAVQRSSGIVSDKAEVLVGWQDRSTPPNASAKEKGDSVIIKIDHKYNFLFFPWSMTVVSCADMRLESPDGAATAAPPTC